MRFSIVTGSSKGIGLCVVKRLICKGVHVVGISRSGTAIEDEKFTSIEMDVCDINRDTILNTLTSKYGVSVERIEICSIIHNAAMITPIDRIADTSSSEWKTTFSLNFFSAIDLLKAFKPNLTLKATFTIVSSGASINAKAGWGAYCTSKAAVNMFIKCLAMEEPDIIALSVDPGIVDTDMQTSIRTLGKDVMDAKTHERFSNLHKDGLLLDGDVPGKSIAWLALNADVSMSGQFIVHTDGRIVEMN